MRPFLLLIPALLALSGISSAPAATRPHEPRELTNLRAFARLYGVIRFFHPSDEAAVLDWNRYAVLGVSRVRAAGNRPQLKRELEWLVHGIAPTVQIDDVGSKVEHAALPSGDELVMWQHRGPGFDVDRVGPYLSKRTARDVTLRVPGATWASATQWIDAVPYRGKPFRLSTYVRVSASAEAGAWAQVERSDGTRGFFDDMSDRLVDGQEWAPAVVEGVIDDDASRLLIGGWLEGEGEVWLDDFELTIAGVPVAVANAGFEDGTADWGGDVTRKDDGTFSFTFDVDHPGHGGASALRIAPRTSVKSDDLFSERVTAGEAAEVELGDGLVARVPLALWSRNGHTLPLADPSLIRSALGKVTTTLDDADARIADLIVAWSVFDQFYPYFDVVGADWQAVLDRTLSAGLAEPGVDGHGPVLRLLVAALDDGHGSVRVPGPEPASLPVRLVWADRKVVVAASAVPELIRGDVIEAIDGVPTSKLVDAELQLVSGSPQWKRMKVLQTIGSRAAGAPIRLRVGRASGIADVTVRAGEPPEMPFPLPPIAQLTDGTQYFDLTRVTAQDLDAGIPDLSQAPAVIFDLRGYPSDDMRPLINHLLINPEKSRWMHVPQIVRPALPGVPRSEPRWEDRGWDLVPAEPRITGRVVFLTDARAISFAESLMGYVETLGIEIVGSPTAGANGNIRRVSLPTGCAVTFTGAKVTRHDRSQSHLLGIAPTIPVEPTIEGLREGRDEVLDRAIELIGVKTDAATGTKSQSEPSRPATSPSRQVITVE